MTDWTPSCPHARKVEGVTPADGGVICGAMERDQARKDPILEGAPIGVFVSLKDDPGTIDNFCAGGGEPMLDPDEILGRPYGKGHYSGCPIYAATREISDAERAFALEGGRPSAVPGLDVGPMEVADAEVDYFTRTGERVR